MSLTLHTIQAKEGAKKAKKKVGRGGKRGTYAGKGLKGQKARSGTGGLKRLAMRPLIERTKKHRGFKSRNEKPVVFNLSTLATRFKDGDKVNLETLEKSGLLKDSSKGVKILGTGDISIKLEIANCEVSATAKTKIEKAGGKIL
jgi:large subunit ribosomal protein L15